MQKRYKKTNFHLTSLWDAYLFVSFTNADGDFDGRLTAVGHGERYDYDIKRKGKKKPRIIAKNIRGK